jgi:DNA-directed RNA polymerase subunit M
MVDFCEKCGAIVIGKKGEEVSCSSCGHGTKAKSAVSLSQKISKKEEIEIVDTDKSSEVHPTTEVDCPECSHNLAYYWTKQTRAGDEPETQFFKCVSCNHQWRDYR